MRLVFKLSLPVLLPALVLAQGRGRGQPTPVGRAGAPVDLTGYWVSVVTEDWRYRMVTPAKGDYPSIPLNPEGRKVADAWDPAKDEAAGNQCKAYGAGGIMRVPERLHITWENDTTLRLDTDAGMQTRRFHFGDAQAPAESDWQGSSQAQWDRNALKVVTTRMKPGYLQKNGVPYSANAVITEYLHRTSEPNGDSWLIVTTLVEDRQYLTGPFQRSTHFKKQASEAGWRPVPCSAR
jgi:hypothetical protein